MNILSSKGRINRTQFLIWIVLVSFLIWAPTLFAIEEPVEKDIPLVDFSELYKPEPSVYKDVAGEPGRSAERASRRAVAIYGSRGVSERLGEVGRANGYGFFGELIAGIPRSVINVRQSFLSTCEKVADRVGAGAAENFFNSWRWRFEIYYGTRMDGFMGRPEHHSLLESLGSDIGEGTFSLMLNRDLSGVIFVVLLFGVSRFVVRHWLHSIKHGIWLFWGSFLIPGGYVVLVLPFLIHKGRQALTRYKKRAVVNVTDDDGFYQQAYEELEGKQVDKALWAKILAQSGGNESKARSRYIKNRVKILKTVEGA